jgi:regulatory protein
VAFPRRRSARSGAGLDESRAGDPDAARATAIGLLARREHASAELAAALARKGYAAEAIAAAVSRLREERLLDDSRYAEGLVRMLTRRGQGPVRIRQALAEAGITGAGIEAALAAATDFRALAGEVRRRRFGGDLPAEWSEKARQMRFLQYRGFSTDQITAALAGSGGDVDLDPDA